MIVNRLPLSFALAIPLVFAGCGGGGLTLPPEGEAANIRVVEGSGQSGRVGSMLGLPLLVEVTDTRGRPVVGATVVFSFASTTLGEAITPSMATNSDGQASSAVRLGFTPGTVTGKVEVPVDEGITPVEASFTAIALPEDADSLAYVSGAGQSAPVNSPLPAPLVVQVIDRFGNPISGVPIVWSITGGGTVSEASSVTDANGQSSVTRTLGGTAGEQTTLATVGGLAGSPVTFTHIATAGSATGVVKISGDGQSALAGTELDDPLVVRVLDGEGNPIPNRAVTWVTGDGSVNPEITATDGQGYASTSWTLGPTPGANKTANAVVSGLTTATFTATATAGAPSASASSVSASPGTITAGSGTSTIAVTVRDASNNPISGVSVTLESTGNGNTINPASASTGANGVATFTFSSTVAEGKTITATAGGVTIDDRASITVQKATSIIEISSDDPDPSVVGQAVAVEFAVRGGGATPTGSVTVTVSGGPETCSVTLANGSGSCSVTLLAPGTPNNRRIITATYTGDDRFTGDSDTENHRVDPAPVANNAPTAAFAAPSCTVGQPCQFTDGSSDSDGSIQSRVWSFQDGIPASSTEQNPLVTFGSEGSKTVSLTVTDDDGATDIETKQVLVAAAPPPPNQAPVAQGDAYTTPGAGQALTVPAPGVLANDSDPDGDVISALSASDPALGSVSLSPDGGFTYTPDPGATGDDTFTYEASDGSLTTTATVTITIIP